MNHNPAQTAPQESLLKAAALSKRFGKARVLSDLSFEIFPQDFLLLLGANGSGKSTLSRILAGLLRADSGEVKRNPKTKLGYCGHQLLLYSALSVRENLELFRSLTGSETPIDVILEGTGLAEVADNPVQTLSRGQQTKLTLERMFLGNPELLILDEPTASLDDHATKLLMERLAERRANGATVILVTHDLHRTAQAATRAMVLKSGSILADSAQKKGEKSQTVSELIALYREENR